MKHVLSQIAGALLIAAISAGCGQHGQTSTTTVDSYTVSASPGAAFIPTKVTDDGKATTIQLPMPYRGTPPALFVMDGNRGADTLRYSWDGPNSRFVVDGHFKRVVLVLDDKRVTIIHD